MGWDELFKILSDIAAADSLSYGIVGALTLVAFVIMRAMLPVKGLAIVFAPAIFWGGLAGIYTASVWGFAVSTEKAVNVVAASVLGMIVALLVMVALARLADAATRIRDPLAAPADAARRPRF
jgi:hypothetical protein